MSAELARFAEDLENAIAAGALTREQAMRLEFDVCARTNLPWLPEAFAAHQRFQLYLFAWASGQGLRTARRRSVAGRSLSPRSLPTRTR